MWYMASGTRVLNYKTYELGLELEFYLNQIIDINENKSWVWMGAFFLNSGFFLGICTYEELFSST